MCTPDPRFKLLMVLSHPHPRAPQASLPQLCQPEHGGPQCCPSTVLSSLSGSSVSACHVVWSCMEGRVKPLPFSLMGTPQGCPATLSHLHLLPSARGPAPRTGGPSVSTANLLPPHRAKNCILLQPDLAVCAVGLGCPALPLPCLLVPSGSPRLRFSSHGSLRGSGPVLAALGGKKWE